MEKEQKSKSLGKNLLVALVVLMAWFLIIRVGTSFASKNSFEVTDAEISTKSPYVEISDFKFEKGKIASNVVFHKVGDSVTYKLKLKNTDESAYTIKSVSDNNKNNHVSYTYANYAGKKVNAKEEFTFELTEKYALENNDVSNRNQNLSVTLTFEIEDEKGNANETIIPINTDEENIPAPVFPITGGDSNEEVYHVADGDTVVKVSPKTGDSIVLYVVIFAAAVGLLIVATRKKNVLEETNDMPKPHGVKRLKILSFFVIVGAALFPTISRALSSSTITFTSIISFKDKLIVTYKVNGQTFEKVIPYESKIELDDPEVPGYKFDRWEDKDGNKFDSETPITNDLELTAIFNPIEYTLSYELNDGTVDPENPTTYTIESTDISLTKPTKNGYKFTGWTGTGLEDKTEDVTIATGSMENREYTANWEEETYTITCDLDGGAVEAGNIETYTINSEDITLNNPTREGYTFAGWTGTGLDDKVDSVTIAKGSTGNKEYKANWTIDEYTITYNLNNGTSENETTYTVETEDITLNNPTREGYTFAGWTGTGLDDKADSVTITKGSIGNREYTANWTANTYTITFDANTGLGSMENESITYDVEKTLTENAFTKEDNNFKGWNTKADGSGTSYNDKQAVKNLLTGGNITLYAQWQELAEYTVTFDATSEGTLEQNTKVVKEGKKVGELPTPTPKQEDYRFVAWYTDQNFTTKVTEDTVINGDVTFYAKYKYYMSIVFSATSEVKFNGKDVNMESTDARFTSGDYIDTGVQLFTNTNIKKDFEISFEIVSYDQTENVDQASLVASKYEKESLNYPGFVFRKHKTSTNSLEITSRTKATGNGYTRQYNNTTVHKVTIKRNGKKIYYKINDGNFVEMCDMQDLFDRGLTFETTVTFGATVDENNVSMRHFTGTLKNMIIKLED